jgi:type I site-specific restriction endonuclease
MDDMGNENRALSLRNRVNRAGRQRSTDAAVKKITGSVDRVGTLIRSYRNDADPKIAVTVDLLTTGH